MPAPTTGRFPREPRASCEQSEHGQGGGPAHPTVHAGTREVLGRAVAPREEKQVVGALRAALGLWVEEQRRQDAEEDDTARVRRGDHAGHRARAQPAARVGQDRVRDERRARGAEREPDRERDRRSDLGVVPLRHEPREAGGRQQQPAPARRSPQPAGEAARDQRPSGGEERGACRVGGAREPVAGVVARGPQREDPGGDSQAEDPDGDRPPSHASIVARAGGRSNRCQP